MILPEVSPLPIHLEAASTGAAYGFPPEFPPEMVESRYISFLSKVAKVLYRIRRWEYSTFVAFRQPRPDLTNRRQAIWFANKESHCFRRRNSTAF